MSFNAHRHVHIIPDDPRYDIFRMYVKSIQECDQSGEIPKHLKDKYTITASNASNSIVTRNALTVTEKIKKIVTKLSDLNKDKLFKQITQMTIDVSDYASLVDMLFTFSVDLEYMQKIYVELYRVFKSKVPDMYSLLHNKVISLKQEDMISRWQIANSKLIAEMYTVQLITLDEICTIYDTLSINPDNIRLEMLYTMLSPHGLFKLVCEKRLNAEMVIESFSINREFTQKVRYFISCLLETLFIE